MDMMVDYNNSVQVKVGDLVYFYFMHVFCVPGRIDIDNAEPSTGRFEMRCRPARVVAVNPPRKPTGCRELDSIEAEMPMPIGQVHLDIEFQPDDRIPLPGGCGGRPSRSQRHVGAHLGPNAPGELAKGWPDPGKWAHTAKTVDID